MKKMLLDHGSVELVDHMGDDRFLAQTARTSTDTSSGADADNRLVTRLVRDRHTSPIEFGVMVFDIDMPIFVCRQWMRHRTGAFNEFSMRYSEAKDVYYVPEISRCQVQSIFNKQGSAEELPVEAAGGVIDTIITASESAYRSYRYLLDTGLTRELARSVLPTNFYTRVRWKIDLHNLMHFIKLRDDPHAQYEIRVYAQAIYDIACELYPNAMAAFRSHVKDKVGVTPELASELASYIPDGHPTTPEVQKFKDQHFNQGE